MGDTTGGPLYIGGDSAADEFVQDHAATMDGTQVRTMIITEIAVTVQTA